MSRAADDLRPGHHHPTWEQGKPSWSRWDRRSWPRRAGWSSPLAGLASRATRAPERWPFPRRPWTAPGSSEAPRGSVGPTWSSPRSSGRRLR